MEEKQVTIQGETYELPDVFFVVATQNPVEYEGTYPLPEAQQDRFLFKLQIDFPSFEEEKEVLQNVLEHQLAVRIFQLFWICRHSCKFKRKLTILH